MDSQGYFQSVGDCMGYLYSPGPSDRQEFCRTLEESSDPFDTFGDCIQYMRALEERFERP